MSHGAQQLLRVMESLRHEILACLIVLTALIRTSKINVPGLAGLNVVCDLGHEEERYV